MNFYNKQTNKQTNNGLGTGTGLSLGLELGRVIGKVSICWNLFCVSFINHTCIHGVPPPNWYVAMVTVCVCLECMNLIGSWWCDVCYVQLLCMLCWMGGCVHNIKQHYTCALTNTFTQTRTRIHAHMYAHHTCTNTHTQTHMHTTHPYMHTPHMHVQVGDHHTHQTLRLSHCSQSIHAQQHTKVTELP